MERKLFSAAIVVMSSIATIGDARPLQSQRFGEVEIAADVKGALSELAAILRQRAEKVADDFERRLIDAHELAARADQIDAEESRAYAGARSPEELQELEEKAKAVSGELIERSAAHARQVAIGQFEAADELVNRLHVWWEEAYGPLRWPQEYDPHVIIDVIGFPSTGAWPVYPGAEIPAGLSPLAQELAAGVFRFDDRYSWQIGHGGRDVRKSIDDHVAAGKLPAQRGPPRPLTAAAPRPTLSADLPRGSHNLGLTPCSECHAGEWEWYRTSIFDDEKGWTRGHLAAGIRLNHWSGDERPDQDFAEAVYPGVGRGWRYMNEDPKGPCAECHGTYLAGKGLEVGVGCEKCHGPGENYIEPHAQPGNRARAIDAGMWDIREKPEVWAGICMDCHVVTNQALLDGGHPSGADFDLGAAFDRVEPHLSSSHVTYEPAYLTALGEAYRKRILVYQLPS